jgi:hypothetical protein
MRVTAIASTREAAAVTSFSAGCPASARSFVAVAISAAVNEVAFFAPLVPGSAIGSM